MHYEDCHVAVNVIAPVQQTYAMVTNSLQTNCDKESVLRYTHEETIEVPDLRGPASSLRVDLK